MKQRIRQRALAAFACGVVLVTGLAGCSAQTGTTTSKQDSDSNSSPEAVVTSYLNTIKQQGTNPDALEQTISEIVPEAVLQQGFPSSDGETISEYMDERANKNANYIEAMNQLTDDDWNYTTQIAVCQTVTPSNGTVRWICSLVDEDLVFYSNLEETPSDPDNLEVVYGFSDSEYQDFGLTVEERQIVAVKTTASAAEEGDYTGAKFYLLVKIDGKWYLDVDFLLTTGSCCDLVFLWPADFLISRTVMQADFMVTSMEDSEE